MDDYFRAKDPKPLIFCNFASGHGGDAAYNEARAVAVDPIR